MSNLCEPTRIDAVAAAKWGKVQWVLPLITILMDGASQSTCAEVSELLADNHWRCDTSLASPTPQGEHVDPALDNASATKLKALQHKANQLINSNSARLETLAELLAQPKANIPPGQTRALKGMLVSTDTPPSA